MATNFTRKNLKEFSANNKSGLQVFGSRASNSPSNSSDPEILQSNPNFELGWRAATLLNPSNGTRLPQIDEMAALDYIHNYALNYILQKGIPEYNAATSYFTGDLARDVGGTEIYKSITDDNLGNALNDTANWELQGDLSFLKNVPSNEIPVSSLNDLPAPVGGEIILEDGKRYVFNEVVISSFPLVIPTGAFVTISCVDLSKAFVYLGTGAAIRGVDFGLLVMDLFLLSTPSGAYFDFDGLGSVYAINTIGFDAVQNSIIACNVFGSFFALFDAFGGGFESRDRTDTLPRSQFSISHSVIEGNGSGNDIISCEGNLSDFAILDSSVLGASGDTLLNLDKSLLSNADIQVQSTRFTTDAGVNIFDPNGLDQKAVNSKYTGNIGIPDSTVSLKITFEGNSSPTTITVAGQNEPISLNTTYAIDNSIERFVLQDLCTFDFTTDTISTTFNHGLSNDDIIQFSTYTGTLPTGLDSSTNYFIINSAAATFQVSLTQGGVAVDFSDNGAGTLYYRHITGVSVSGEAIYVGREDVVIKPSGWVSIINTANANDGVRGAIMKIDANGNIIEDQAASLITVNNTRPQSSVIVDSLNLSTGEGIVIYIRNDDATNNLIAEENISILTKV